MQNVYTVVHLFLKMMFYCPAFDARSVKQFALRSLMNKDSLSTNSIKNSNVHFFGHSIFTNSSVHFKLKCRRGRSRGRVQGVRGGGPGVPPPPPPPRDDLRFSNTIGILQKQKTMWSIGVEVEQETSAPPPKKKSWIRP